MTICEYQFPRFDTRGTDAYLDRFAAKLDDLFCEGWILSEATRDRFGWWQVCLYREQTAIASGTRKS